MRDVPELSKEYLDNRRKRNYPFKLIAQEQGISEKNLKRYRDDIAYDDRYKRFSSGLSLKWHTRGWRDNRSGEMNINLKQRSPLAPGSWASSTIYATDDSTIDSLIRSAINSVQSGDYDGSELRVFFRSEDLKKSQNLRVGDLFNGNEAIYVKSKGDGW